MSYWPYDSAEDSPEDYARMREEDRAMLIAADARGSTKRTAESSLLNPGFHPAYALTQFKVEAQPAAWPQAFVIITAWATTGENWTLERNQTADAALKLRLDRLGVWMHRITGQTPDGTHAEPGWAVTVDLTQGRQLGREFLQDAIYEVSGGVLWVVSCHDERAATLGPFAERI